MEGKRIDVDMVVRQSVPFRISNDEAASNLVSLSFSISRLGCGRKHRPGPAGPLKADALPSLPHCSLEPGR
jgi:hypothetical protein